MKKKIIVILLSISMLLNTNITMAFGMEETSSEVPEVIVEYEEDRESGEDVVIEETEELPRMEVLEESSGAEEDNDYDIWLAQSLIQGVNNQGSGLYPMFQGFQDPVYKQLGEYLLEDKPLVSMSASWSVFLNGEYRNQFANEQKYIYEVILMDYLKYNAEKGTASADLENKALEIGTKLYSLLSDELSNNAGDYIDGEMSLEQAIKFYQNVEDIGEISEAISVVKVTAETVNDLITAVADYLALSQVKEEKILLLKAARDGSQLSNYPNQDFIRAADELIAILGQLMPCYMEGEKWDIVWNLLCDMGWEMLCDANPVLKTIDLGADGLNRLFDTSNKASHNLKLALFYTTDWYMKRGMMNSTDAFLKEQSITNARQFNSCFKAYIEFQQYGNDFANTWLKGYLDSGFLGDFINNIFYRDNIKTAKDMINLSKSQISQRKKLLELIDKYADIYEAMKDGDGKAPKAIFLNKTALSLYPSEKFKLKAVVTGMTAKVTWSSSNPSIATVGPKGTVTAKKIGKTVITAKAGNKSTQCQVQVLKPTIKLNKSSIKTKLGAEGKIQLKATVQGKSSKVKWKTSNKKIATVTANGRVTPKAAGEVRISATANGVTAKCKITIRPLEITDYLNGAGSSSTVTDMKKLSDGVGKMSKKKNKKYPHLYRTGNKLQIGVNNRPVYGTSKDEYIRIVNTGNTSVRFYGVKIGETRKQMERKFGKDDVRITTWDGGKTYSNSNAWILKVNFVNGKLKSYTYICRPTS